MTNLLENALKYSPTGSPIQVRARMLPTAELEVRVSDRGIGIPPSELHAIFDKFYRVQQVRLPWAGDKRASGTGLGLAICASILRAHGGRIWAERRSGGGATLIFTLPVPEQQAGHELPALAEVPATAHDEKTGAGRLAAAEAPASQAAGAEASRA